MTTDDILSRLESLGSESTRRTYLRHGATEPLFGVKYAALYKLEKEIKKALRKEIDRVHERAVDLWESGNHDARTLATLLADPARLDAATLDAWLAGGGVCVGLIDAVAGLAAKSPHAAAKRESWRQSPDERTGRAGWRLVAEAAMRPVPLSTLSDAYLDERLAEIEADIHTAPNRKREAMNSALIAIGIRGDDFTAKALAAAARIGKVHIDHGDTSCKTPDAASYIQKTLARK